MGCTPSKSTTKVQPNTGNAASTAIHVDNTASTAHTATEQPAAQPAATTTKPTHTEEETTIAHTEDSHRNKHDKPGSVPGSATEAAPLAASAGRVDSTEARDPAIGISAQPSATQFSSARIFHDNPTALEPKLRLIRTLHDDYSVDMSKQSLGEGSFGEVLLGVQLATGKRVAIKRVKPSVHNADGVGLAGSKLRLQNKARVHEEAHIMKLLKGHDRVIQLLDHCEDEAGWVYIIMNLAEGGDLMKYVLQSKRFTERVAAYLFKQMVEAVRFCHSVGVVHRDLKPENMLFQAKTGDAQLMLADFGLAHVLRSPSDVITDAVGSAYFIAPEMFARKYGPECDTWSLGVILYLLLSGTVPFGAHAKRARDVYRSIRHDSLKFKKKVWSGISAGARELLVGLLDKDPARRYTLDYAAQHPWVTGSAPDTLLDPSVLAQLTKFDADNKLRQAVLQLVATRISAEQLAQLRQQFHAVDRDTDQALSVDELHAALMAVGMDATAEQVHALMQRLDVDGDGLLDLNEFLGITAEFQLMQHQRQIWETFQELDKDKNGTISAAELRTVMKDSTAEQVRTWMAEYDTNGDGLLQYEEFVNMMIPADAEMKHFNFAGRGPRISVLDNDAAPRTQHSVSSGSLLSTPAGQTSTAEPDDQAVAHT